MAVRPGTCACGCGEATPISRETNRTKGWLKGVPRKWIHGHQLRATGPRFVERGPMDCWIWQRSLDSGGYGLQWTDGTHKKAHRAVYEELVSPVPLGLVLHHICGVRSCVNPGHLEPLTHPEHHRRHTRTHCKHGHPLSGDNLRITPQGNRICRTCRRRIQQAWEQKQREYERWENR